MATWNVIHGDCLEVLKTLEAGSIDAVVTDPPFGIGFKYNSHDDTADGYGEWLWNRIEMAEALCSDGSPLFVWQAMLNIRQLATWIPRDWRIFAACKNFVQMRPCAMQYGFDPVVVWWKDGERYGKGTNSRDWYICDTNPSTRRIGGDNFVAGHPCPRPLDVACHIVDQWVKPEGTVLDLFCGSGTTGVACMKLGRNFIGIEIDASYCEIARRRIAEAANHLFAEVESAASA